MVAIPTRVLLSQPFLPFLSLVLLPCYAHHPNLKLLCKFDQIYQLGDSISDTGNFIRETPLGPASPFARLPYGQSFFNGPTGRCSNGLLIIDYLAMAAGLPFLSPYKDIAAGFRHGANFAVAGSTALPAEFLATKNISSQLTNSSLGVQLDWMFTHFNSICYSQEDCIEKLKHSLFVVGEIGVNDYNYAILQGKAIQEVKAMVSDVVQAIKDATRRVISYGAAQVVVPGYLPMGCSPAFLTMFQTNRSEAYDKNFCLNEPNELIILHNDHLNQAIEELKQEFPSAIIVYGDYYNAFLWLLRKASNLGFDALSARKACCGIEGDYNFSPTRMCGAPEVPVCPNPDQYISWDGFHLTQKAHMVMAEWLMHKIFPNLHCNIAA